MEAAVPDGRLTHDDLVRMIDIVLLVIEQEMSAADYLLARIKQSAGYIAAMEDTIRRTWS